MNEELIRQCAREVVPFVDEPGTGEQNYRYAAAVMAIETYHARAVAPLVEVMRQIEIAGHGGFLTAELAGDMATKALAAFGNVSAQKAHTPTLAPEVRALVEAAMEARRIAMEQTVKARPPECRKFGEIAQDLDAALAPFQQEAK